MPFHEAHSTRAPRRIVLSRIVLSRIVLSRIVLIVATLLTAPAQVAAQTLAEVTFVAATVTTLNPAIRLPSGSLRAVGPGVDALLARLPDGSAWTEPEAYVARGIASRLRPAFEHQIVTGFAAAGLFETSRRTVPDGAGTRTRIEFEGPAGERALLVLFDVPEEVTWLVARSR